MKIHLIKGGAGMAIKTSCGRNILRAHIGTNWADFNSLPEHHKCEKCSNSKQAALNAKSKI